MKRREFVKLASATGLSLAVTPQSAFGKQMTQVSAIQRFQVGDFAVTALSDGFLQMNDTLFPSVSDTDFQAALQNSFLDSGAFLAAVNAYVIDDGTDVHLVDTGGGGFTPTVGQLGDNLAAAGYAPDQIKTLIATHLHPDHIGGAVTNGSPTYPNAEFVVSSADHAFWTNADIRAGVPETVQPFFDMAAGTVAAYGDKVRLFEGEADIISGLTAAPLPGHTPGHSGFVLSSGNETLFIWGDIVHAPPLQFADPSVTIVFDIDQTAAAATRAKVMDQVTTDRLTVAGMHLSFPGVGNLEKRGSGYEFQPAAWHYN